MVPHTAGRAWFAAPFTLLMLLGVPLPFSDATVDTKPPTVAWQTPTQGQAVSGVLNEANGNCQVDATDDVAVSRVDFYLDGRWLNRERYAPYACNWDTGTATSGRHRLMAVAVDGSGRKARSSIGVVVGSLPTQPPPGGVTPITGQTYFVSPTGSDGNDGRSTSTAWRTVGRASSAGLEPGDGVLFEGGKTFSDDALTPTHSGTASRRIVYGSYGTGKASLPGGIYLINIKGLAFQNLAISGPSHGVAASASGTGAADVTLENLSISNVGIAVNSANWGDTNWTIRNNVIAHTGDSGMILYGSNFLVTGNSISDTGTDDSIGYGKHGIYLKVIDATLTYNTITGSDSEGISVRYRNSVIEHNDISGAEDGIGWYQYDPVAGTTYWRYNTISNTTGADIYVSPWDPAGGSTRESFVITNNTLSKLSGQYLNLHPTSGTYTVSDNILK